MFFQFFPETEVLIAQAGRLAPGENGVAGQVGQQIDFVAFDRSANLVCARPIWTEYEIAFEMMEGIERIFQLVVVKQGQLVMHLGALGGIVERGFVEIDRAHEVTLGRFGLGIFDQLRVTRSDHAITTRKRQRNGECKN